MTQPKLFSAPLPPANHDSLDEAYYTTLKNLLESGDTTEAKDIKSVGGGKENLELLNYSQSINNIRRRVISGGGRQINFPAAIARFVWMMSGSDRLSDIAFYEPRVSSFTDDGISIPGSSYGQRILRPRPGINQLVSVVDTLRKDSGSRRAAISIYQAEDAARESSDIPCTFGLFYGIRNGVLHSTTIMRSNNAFVLFPYNVFEFSLLSEVVATELEVKLGPLFHYAFSMHIYRDNYKGAREAISSKPERGGFEMRPIPAGLEDWDRPLEQIRRLTILESIMRHRIAGISISVVDHFINLPDNKDGNLTFGKYRENLKLNDYWNQFYYLLALHGILNNTGHFSQSKNEFGIEYSGTEEGIKIFNKFFDLLWDEYKVITNFTVKQAAPIDAPSQIELPTANNVQFIASHQSPLNSIIKDAIGEFESISGKNLSWQVLDRLQTEFLEQVAARQGEDLKAVILRRLNNEQ